MSYQGHDIKDCEGYTRVITTNVGYTQSNKTNFLNNSVWHSSAWRDNPLGQQSHLNVTYTAKFDLKGIRTSKSATVLRIRNLGLKAAQSYWGTVTSGAGITSADVFLDGVKVGSSITLNPSSFTGDTTNWQDNPLIGATIDVIDKSTLEVRVNIDLFCGFLMGGIDWYFGELRLDYEYDTLLPLQSVYVMCQAPTLAGISVKIGNETRNTDMSGTISEPFQLTAGSYIAYASLTVPNGDTNEIWRGSLQFTVPYDQIPLIVLTGPSLLPGWWWIPVVGVSGLVTAYILVRALKGSRRRRDSNHDRVIVVK